MKSSKKLIVALTIVFSFGYITTINAQKVKPVSIKAVKVAQQTKKTKDVKPVSIKVIKN